MLQYSSAQCLSPQMISTPDSVGQFDLSPRTHDVKMINFQCSIGVQMQTQPVRNASLHLFASYASADAPEHVLASQVSNYNVVYLHSLTISELD